MSTTWEKIPETGEVCFVIDKEPFMKHEIYPARARFYWDMFQKSDTK